MLVVKCRGYLYSECTINTKQHHITHTLFIISLIFKYECTCMYVYELTADCFNTAHFCAFYVVAKLLLYLRVITDHCTGCSLLLFYFLYTKMTMREDFPEMYLFIHYCLNFLSYPVDSTLFVPTPSVVNPDTHTPHTHFTACVITYRGKENSKLCLLFSMPVIPRLGLCEQIFFTAFFSFEFPYELWVFQLESVLVIEDNF